MPPVAPPPQGGMRLCAIPIPAAGRFRPATICIRLRPRFWRDRLMFLDVVFFLASAVLDLLWWAVLLAVIVQMLIQFGVLDTRNRLVWTISDFLYRVTEPLFGRVRRVLPNFGPIDLSPLAVLLLITAGQMLLGAIRGYLWRSGLYF
jgi:YggT family protein